MKDLKKETIFSIETSLDSNWISNKKIREASRFKIQSNLLEFLLGTSNLNEIWTKGSCLHLGINSIPREEFEVQTMNFLDFD
jgi:hypothetical protein